MVQVRGIYNISRGGVGAGHNVTGPYCFQMAGLCGPREGLLPRPNPK